MKNDIEPIVARIEAKLRDMEKHHAGLQAAIAQKRTQVQELENTIAKLRALQAKLG